MSPIALHFQSVSNIWKNIFFKKNNPMLPKLSVSARPRFKRNLASTVQITLVPKAVSYLADITIDVAQCRTLLHF